MSRRGDIRAAVRAGLTDLVEALECEDGVRGEALLTRAITRLSEAGGVDLRSGRVTAHNDDQPTFTAEQRRILDDHKAEMLHSLELEGEFHQRQRLREGGGSLLEAMGLREVDGGLEPIHHENPIDPPEPTFGDTPLRVALTMASRVEKDDVALKYFMADEATQKRFAEAAGWSLTERMGISDEDLK